MNVGYGTSATLSGQPGFPFDGVRKESQSEFKALQPNWLGILENPHATGLGGDCYGDSGGPTFLDGNPDGPDHTPAKRDATRARPESMCLLAIVFVAGRTDARWHVAIMKVR